MQRFSRTCLPFFLGLDALGIRYAYFSDLAVGGSGSCGWGAFYVGLHMELDPEWHVYWKNPGSSGYGVSIDWELPEGVKAGPIEWPAPERFEFDGLLIMGIVGITFLVPLEISTSVSEVLELQASVSWLACKTSCIPGSAEFKLSLPLAEVSALDSTQQVIFEQARARLPQAWKAAPLTYEAGRGWARIHLQTAAIAEAYFYPETADWVDVDAPQVLSHEAGMPVLTLQLLPGAELKKFAGVLELDGQAWEVELQSTEVVAAQANQEAGWERRLLGSGLGGWLLLAFLGGVLLNIMPCVLPVLSLKVFSLVKHAGQSRRQAISYGLAYTLGVVLSFVVLASALFVLRGLGERIGWGFQLQNPAFVVALALLLLIFALNLLGVFEMGASLVGADSKVARRTDLWVLLGPVFWQRWWGHLVWGL